MRQNALLRSGKDLGAPGTARRSKKTTVIVAPVPADERDDHFACATACDAPARTSSSTSMAPSGSTTSITSRRRCAAASPPPGATLLHIHLHHFQPKRRVGRRGAGGEPHLDPHLAGRGYAALDVFMCGKANPDACVPVLREAFNAKRVAVNELLRGQGRLSGL